MDETRRHLIDAARTLFAEQGYGATTMQQIADRVGISKGAVYLHFRSKQQLLTAMLETMGDDLLDEVRAVLDRVDLDPRAKLHTELRLHFEDVLANQRLMEVYLKEAKLSIDEDLLLMAQKMRVDALAIQEDFLRLLFPELDAAAVTDLAVCLNGALNEYYTYVMLEGVAIDAERVADFLVALAEVTAGRLARGDLEPVLPVAELPARRQLEEELERASDRRLATLLESIAGAAEDLDDEPAAELRETVELVRRELSEDEPNRLVLQGLLANLREHKGLLQERRELASLLGLKLL